METINYKDDYLFFSSIRLTDHSTWQLAVPSNIPVITSSSSHDFSLNESRALDKTDLQDPNVGGTDGPRHTFFTREKNENIASVVLLRGDADGAT